MEDGLKTEDLVESELHVICFADDLRYMRDGKGK